MPPFFIIFSAQLIETDCLIIFCAVNFKDITRNLYLIPVYLYKGLISPFTGPCCRYTPSCSVYMMESVKKHGIIKGTIMGTARLLRCRRSFLGGPDPVPDEWSWARIRSDWIAYKKPKNQ